MALPRLAGLIFGLSLLGSAPAAEAGVRALLIGVSDYDDALGIADLAGPPNDVRLLERALEARDVSDVTVLSDGIEGAPPPTRQAILAALAALAAEAGPGDLVYVHFSGHGTQQFDHDGDESDGLDEVFLPADAARGEPGSGRIANAISDDEIGAAMARIRAAGADVWLVMDSCHSGSGMRAVGTEARARFVDPAVFGIDATAAHERDGTAPVETMTTGDLPGGIVAFYAAQSDELAYEVEIGAEGRAYGLFSAKLAARLQDRTALSYRQLFQAVLSDMNAAPGSGTARSQTPLWEGTLGEAAVLGGGDTAGLRQFQVEGDTVFAGLVHGFPEGTLVALVTDAAAAQGEVIGFAQLEGVGPASATLRHVAGDCAPDSATLCPEVAPPGEPARFARLVAAPPDLALRLSPVFDLASGDPLPRSAPLAAALAQAVAEVNAQGRHRVEIGAADFAVEAGAADGALRFGSPALIGETPAGPRWTPSDGPLAPLLTRIAEAERLARMLTAADPGAALLNRNPVAVETMVRRVDPARLAPPDRHPSIFEECGAALGAPDVAEGPLQPAERLKPCDQIFLRARGTRDAAYDVNRIRIDAGYCVTVAHERLEGTAPATGAITEDITLCNERCPGGPEPGGQERLFVVVSAARPGAEPLNLSGVLDNCGDTGARSIDGGSRAAAFLADLAGGEGARSASLLAGPKTLWVESWRWWNMPRPEVYRNAGLVSR